MLLTLPPQVRQLVCLHLDFEELRALGSTCTALCRDVQDTYLCQLRFFHVLSSRVQQIEREPAQVDAFVSKITGRHTRLEYMDAERRAFWKTASDLRFSMHQTAVAKTVCGKTSRGSGRAAVIEQAAYRMEHKWTRSLLLRKLKAINLADP